MSASPASEAFGDGIVSSARRQLPAWLLSFCLHGILLILMGLAVQRVQVGSLPESDREVGVALVEEIEGEREYVDVATAEAESLAEPPQAPRDSALPTESDFQIDPLADLPTGADTAPNLAGVGLPQVGQAGRLQSTTAGGGGQASTTVFGVTGSGSRFVYVFDRSGSMEGFGGRPLAAAKNELLRSLQDLQPIHQFQIIFYNQDPEIFRPAGGAARLVYGTEDQKEQAAFFVRGITATGSTRHLDALRLALGMRPDVVFFLTDADEPRLTEGEMSQVRRMNHSATIHAIEFGYGPQRKTDNFLVQLARENGGQHTYVNVARLRRP